MSTVLQAVIDAVLEVHRPVDAANYGGRSPVLTQVCTGCGTDNGNWQTWPCPTIRAIRRAEHAEQATG